MSDAKGREVFAGIPRSQPGDTAVAFILPDSFPDSQSIALRNLDGGSGVADFGQARKKDPNRDDVAGMMVS